MILRLSAVAFGATIAFSRVVPAQCPNGGPPPCVVQQARRLPPLDANRVVVLPFRVTTADSLFGEGVAELLAPEFTGQAIVNRFRRR